MNYTLMLLLSLGLGAGDFTPPMLETFNVVHLGDNVVNMGDNVVRAV